MFTYTRGDLITRINAGIKGKKDMMVDIEDTINFAVRDVFSEGDLRSSRRSATLTPSLLAEPYMYAAPEDLKGQKLISLIDQANPDSKYQYNLVAMEDFQLQRKLGTVSIDEIDGVRVLYIPQPTTPITYTLNYYSRYGWIDAGTLLWKQNSTEDSDFLVANEEEFNLFVYKGIELAGEEVDEAQASANAGARYLRLQKVYFMDNPSDAMLMTNDYQAQYYV